MNGLARAFWEKIQLYLWRRDQFDNIALRRHFRDHYDIDVGRYSFGCFDRWRMPGPMTVGRYCSIANTVRTVRANHPIDALSTHPVFYDHEFGAVPVDRVTNARLLIEDDVWIGHNAIIMPGCRQIGRGAVVGAGAVVTHNVARYSIVVGNPARKLRDRFEPELVKAIEATKWWELSIQDVRDLIGRHNEAAFAPTAANVAAWQVGRGADGQLESQPRRRH